MVGLPLLEAMRPAIGVLAAPAAGAADGRPPVRMACLFWPNGCNPHTWTPKGRGKDFEFSPILKPLARHKDDVLILTHLSNRGTFTGDGHYVKDAAWLTGTTIHRTTGSDLNAGGVSMDQLAAKRIGVLTPMPSLELGVEPVTTGVDTNVGYTRLYGSHISWSSPTTPVAREINPKLAFDRLFRSGAGKGAGRDDDRSVLDLVADDARALRDRIGQDDRRKLDEYLDSVRAVETRIAFEASDRRARYVDDARARKDIEALGGRVDLYKHDPGRVRERSMNHAEHVRLDARHPPAGPPDRLDAGRHVHVRQLGQQQELLVRRGRQGGPPPVLAPRERPQEAGPVPADHDLAHRAVCPAARPDEADPRRGRDAAGPLDGAVRLGAARRQRARPARPADRAGRPGRRHAGAGPAPRLRQGYAALQPATCRCSPASGAPVERFADSTGPLEGLDNPAYKGTSAG